MWPANYRVYVAYKSSFPGQLKTKISKRVFSINTEVYRYANNHDLHRISHEI